MHMDGEWMTLEEAFRELGCIPPYRLVRMFLNHEIPTQLRELNGKVWRVVHRDHVAALMDEHLRRPRRFQPRDALGKWVRRQH